MNSVLLAKATAVIPHTELLVNVVRLRVRQLAQGARPLILVAPGTGLADIALSEIAEGKLVSESNADTETKVLPAAIVNFPRGAAVKKAA